MTTMKKILFAFLAITIMSTLFVACNSNPKVNNEDVARKVADSLRLAADTAGLSQFQAWKAQNELPNVQDQGQAGYCNSCRYKEKTHMEQNPASS